MKKFIPILLSVCLLLVSLGACGADRIEIEDYEWKMEWATLFDGTSFSRVAVSEEDPANPDAKIVDVTLKADRGKLTVTDVTNGKTYEGTYTVINRTPAGTDYEIKIGVLSGHASVAMTTYADGSQTPTLPINLGESSLAFYSK